MVSTSSMLQDLNIIEHPSPPSDSQDLTTSSPFASDLAAKLDLWSSVNFASDEPLIPERVVRDPLSSPAGYDVKHLDDDVDEADQADPKPDPNGLTIESSHFIPSTKDDASMLEHHHDPTNLLYTLGQFHFLSSLNTSSSSSDNNNTITTDTFQPPTNFESIFSSISSVAAANHTFIIDPALAALSTSDPSSTSPTTPGTRSSSPHQPLPKRPRTSSTSVFADAPTPSSPTTTARSSSKSSIGGSTTSSITSTAPKPNLITPLTPAEDKRRRNTAASARFRAKKKEREVAMDKHAKELEDRVHSLERECESLRRENGWLRGLVVGVAGSVGVGDGIGSSVGTSVVSLRFRSPMHWANS